MSYIVATDQGLFAGTSLDGRPLFTHDYKATSKFLVPETAHKSIQLLLKLGHIQRGAVLSC